jgi:hypothetical protein
VRDRVFSTFKERTSQPLGCASIGTFGREVNVTFIAVERDLGMVYGDFWGANHIVRSMAGVAMALVVAAHGRAAAQVGGQGGGRDTVVIVVTVVVVEPQR